MRVVLCCISVALVTHNSWHDTDEIGYFANFISHLDDVISFLFVTESLFTQCFQFLAIDRANCT